MELVSTAQGYSNALTQPMTAKEFMSLGDEDKRTVLISALEQRERGLENIEAHSTTSVYNVEYSNGKTGEAVEQPSRHVCKHRFKDGAYWAMIDLFRPEDKKRPTMHVETMMDNKLGESRSIAEQGKLSGVYGAIDIKADTTIRNGRFAGWIGHGFDDGDHLPLQYLINHQDAIRFEGLGQDGRTIKISLEVREDIPGKPIVTESRTLWINPEKGFLPVRMNGRWKSSFRLPGRKPLFGEMDTEIIELKQVGGVWFPWHFIEVSHAYQSGKENKQATVRETKVDKVELGRVTNEDLEVNFAPGIEVFDKIRNSRYVIGKNGEKLFVGHATSLKGEEPAGGIPWRWVLVLVSGLLLVGASIGLYLKRRHM